MRSLKAKLHLEAHHAHQVRTYGSRIELDPHRLVQWKLASLITAEVHVVGESAIGKSNGGQSDRLAIAIVRASQAHDDNNAADG